MNGKTEIFSEINKVIYSSKKILILGHKNPDGDAVGSMLALKEYLEHYQNKKADCFLPDPVPLRLRFIDNWDEIKNRKPDLSQYDLICALDYGDFSRTGLSKLQILPYKLKGLKIISIDHHKWNNSIGSIKLIDPDASATAEILFEYFSYNRVNFNYRISNNLLIGIFSDTNGFTNPNMRKETFQIVGRLLNFGASLFRISRELKKDQSEISLRLYGSILSRAFYDSLMKAVVSFLPLKDLQKYGLPFVDLGDISNILAGEVNSYFGVLMIEKLAGVISVHLRTKPEKNIDVGLIARKMGGGGHRLAAAFIFEGDFSSCLKRIRSLFI